MQCLTQCMRFYWTACAVVGLAQDPAELAHHLLRPVTHLLQLSPCVVLGSLVERMSWLCCPEMRRCRCCCRGALAGLYL